MPLLIRYWTTEIARAAGVRGSVEQRQIPDRVARLNQLFDAPQQLFDRITIQGDLQSLDFSV